ncbi:MAG: Ni/Fe hydrogenase subunit alpha [Bryobacteraceae bacterium]|nr:Ni/Fe hydrogenase subunit alpha [Bryobacteraceae bacterium]
MSVRASDAPKGAVTIRVDCLARVEGEGGLQVKLRGDRVQELKLRIFEPPRLFEGFLRGRHFTEVPDITARICGICPIAYQMSSIHALERALGVEIDPMTRLLRRIFYCGEWIESHALHVYMLHAPDFLGCQDVIEMAAAHKQAVNDALRLKKIGNDLVTLIGGREIHPVSAAVGGFYKVPARRQLEGMREALLWALEASLNTVRLVAGFHFPDFEQDYEFVSLSHPDEYPFNEGRLVSNRGIDIDVMEYEDCFAERHVRHSTSLHSAVRARGSFLVGPLARFNLNYEKLTPLARQAAADAGLAPPCRNQFKSIVVRAVELVFACEEALRLIDAYEPPVTPMAPVEVRAATGQAVTEAPRGSLYHRYRIDDDGIVVDARIIAPTSQNLRRIEDDLWSFIPKIASKSVDEMTWQCEQAIRNYDPCISCSCHFLKLHLERAPE